jgi:S1-C subfamily serine protease
MEMIKSSDKIEYKKVEMTSPAGGSRGFGVSLGTIPDYAADVKGVKITGTRAGSAAEQAGIKNGDILIRLAGREILNINDFTNILSDLKAGEKYEAVVTRGTENVTLSIIPQARK